MEYSLGELHSPLPRDCPFNFLHLSSEEPTPDDPLHDLDQSDPLPGDARNQGVSHVPVSADQVLRSEGNERRKWIGACKKELGNLTSTQTIEPISVNDLTRLRRTALFTGNKLIELPATAVFTIKPDKYKVRFVACGNKTAETYGKVATTDLDPSMMRYLLSCAASSPPNSISGLDVTLPTGRICHSQTSIHAVQTSTHTSRSRLAYSQSHLRVARISSFVF